MTKPVINPSSLTEEQREKIRKRYHKALIKIGLGYDPFDKDFILICDLEKKYGKDFFEKGGNNEHNIQ